MLLAAVSLRLKLVAVGQQMDQLICGVIMTHPDMLF